MVGRPLRNLGWLLGSRAVNAVFSLLYLALATRCLGLAEFGRFTLIVVLAQAVNGIASFSAWQAVVHWGIDRAEAGRATGFAVALDLVSVLAGTLLAALAVWSAPLWLPLPPDLRPAAFALCLAALLATRSTPTGVLRLHDRYDLATAAEAVLPAVRAAGAVLAALAFPHLAGFVAAWAVAELACAAAYWRFALRLEPLRFADVSLRQMPRRHDGVWRFVWATSLSRSLGVAAKQLVLLLVGALGGPAAAGGFRVAAQLGQALVQLGEAVSRALYPDLVRARETAGALAGRMVYLALATGGLAVAAAALAGGHILALVAGPDFAFAQGAMIALALAGAAELLGASWDALLVARGRAFLVFALRAVPLLASVLALPLAMARYGLDGAAGCVLLASGLSMAGLGYACLRSGTSR